MVRVLQNWAKSNMAVTTPNSAKQRMSWNKLWSLCHFDFKKNQRVWSYRHCSWYYSSHHITTHGIMQISGIHSVLWSSFLCPFTYTIHLDQKYASLFTFYHLMTSKYKGLFLWYYIPISTYYFLLIYHIFFCQKTTWACGLGVAHPLRNLKVGSSSDGHGGWFRDDTFYWLKFMILMLKTFLQHDLQFKSYYMLIQHEG